MLDETFKLMFLEWFPFPSYQDHHDAPKVWKGMEIEIGMEMK